MHVTAPSRSYQPGSGLTLAGRLAAGQRWDLVFNFAEGVHGRSREAQVPALLEMYGIPYTFSDPLVCALTLDKAMTKQVILEAYQRGLCLIAPIGMYGNVIRIAPPLVISEDQMHEGLDILEAAMKAAGTA